MEAWLQQTQDQFLGFLMILARVSCVLIFAPVLGSDSVPVRLKVPLSLLLSFVVASALGFPVAGRAVQAMWVSSLAGEVLIGVAIGFVSGLAIAGCQLGGGLIGLQMGFGIVNVIDPMSNAQISLLDQFKFILALLILLATNGHHEILKAMANSFGTIAPGEVILQNWTPHYLIDVSELIFIAGVRVAAPVVVALLLVSLATGIISRTVPQINFLVTGFAFRIGLGFLVLLFGVSFFATYVSGLFEDLPGQLSILVRTFAGP